MYNNKFQNELDLELIDYDPTTLIVGTFNPAPPVVNPAAWFYGRTASNCLWNVLPRLYADESLINATEDDWRLFARDKQIAFTDLISSIDDAETDNPAHIKILSGFSDDAIEHNFDDFTFVDIVRLLQRRPSIRNVYITRSITDAFWRHLWNPVMKYCNNNNLHERKLLTPSAATVSYVHEVYNDQHPENQILLPEDFILMRWRQDWHL